MSGRFIFSSTPIEGLYKLERKLIQDHRGFFTRIFCEDEFKDLDACFSVKQINHSLTKKKGTVRGLHFHYPPVSEAKFVSCTKGKIFDVAIDLRINSPTFLKWHSEILTNNSALFIPAGFAHGFQTLTNNCELLYSVSSPHTPDSEGAFSVLDPKLSINWPLEIENMSPRDEAHPFIDEEFKGIKI